MQLLIDPKPPLLNWRQYTARGFRAGQCAADADWLDIAGCRTDRRNRAISVSYRLRHGGDLICRPAARVTPELLDLVRGTIRYSPEYNGLTYKVMRQMMRLLPEADHILLCDTAFFTGLPAESSGYAVPPVLYSRGIKRYGGDGLTHQWVWWKVQKLCGKTAAKVISIQLGDHPNMAAIENGRPLDTTIGFTPVEGLPSHSSCGDIDASVVFELQAAGLSLGEINELLSERSGFRGLTGKPCGFSDLLAAPEEDAPKNLAKKILSYTIMRNIGAFAALLGGAEALAFVTAEPDKSAAFIADICRNLGFMGLKCRFPGVRRGGEMELSDRKSGVKVFVLKDDIWSIMAQHGKNAVQEELV